MFSSFQINIVFSIIEYLGFINCILIAALNFICIFLALILSCNNFIQSIIYNDIVFELIMIIFFMIMIFFIISPALIILCDIDVIMVPCVVVYSCGYQWAWSFNITYGPWIKNCSIDHFLWSMPIIEWNFNYNKKKWFNKNYIYYPNQFNEITKIKWGIEDILFLMSFGLNYKDALEFCSTNPNLNIIEEFVLISKNGINTNEQYIFSDQIARNNEFDTRVWGAGFNSTTTYKFNPKNWSQYIGELSSLLIIPLFLSIKIIVYSNDVIHSFGIYSFGIKIDAIPGRYNLTSIIQTLIKGEHKGFCYELCGHGHSVMLIDCIIM